MKKNNAFTLMELLAVIALLGTILAIAIPKLLNNTSNEKDKIFKMSAINIIKDFNYKHLGEDFTSTTLLKLNLTTISSSDYDLNSSYIYVVNDKTYIYLVGLGEFEGLICHGTVENMLCQEDIATISFVYNLNGGTTSQSFESSYAPNTKITLINPTKAGYTFTGWTVEGTGASLNGSELTTGIETTTITANWERNYVTLTVNLNEGSTTQSFEETYYSLSTLSLINPTKAGYTFTGWTVQGTGASINGTELTIGTSATTITANWIAPGFYPVNSYSCNNGSVGSEPYALTYTGDCEVIDDSDLNWRVKFLTSGTLTVNHEEEVIIDSFLVGGGGGGATASTPANWVYGGGGGGGGYTTTVKDLTIPTNAGIEIEIGAGGTATSGNIYSSTVANGGDGGTTSFGTYASAAGGKGGTTSGVGGAGGSGGGGGTQYTTAIGIGGSNGSDGTKGYSGGAGGAGQYDETGINTSEFGEYTTDENLIYSSGGGGGTGRPGSDSSGLDSADGAGLRGANSGAGGGGGHAINAYVSSGGEAGASGVVVIRNPRTDNVRLLKNKVTLNGETIGYYTGLSEVIDDGNGDWRIRFLTGGTFAYEGESNIDIFLVGGGGKGGTGNASSNGGGGGGAGYTATYSNVDIGTENLYTIVVGAGSTSTSSSGEASSFAGGSIEYTALGGASAYEYTGGAGGSGGGSGGYGIASSNTGGGSGGTNGSDGANNSNGQSRYGTGQHTTTCEFGVGVYGGTCNNGVTMYASGGTGGNGTGRRADSNTCNSGVGYAGGAGSSNTGNGGNGGCGGCSQSNAGGDGGSGIVIMRNAR